MTPGALAVAAPPRCEKSAHWPLRTHAAALLATLLCVGCAAVPQAPAVLAGDSYSGRLALRVDATQGTAARALSAAFELQGDARAGRFNLVSPLGTRLAQARWAPGHVILATPSGEQDFADLDALTREVLGEPIPIAAMFDWLRGQPWPGAASSTLTTPPGFEQLGWTVDLARFDDALINARRERAPAVTVRIKLDRT